MKRLTLKEVEKFASRRGVRRVAVENFLMSMGENEEEARSNLVLDSFLYRLECGYHQSGEGRDRIRSQPEVIT